MKLAEDTLAFSVAAIPENDGHKSDTNSNTNNFEIVYILLCEN